MQVLRGSHNQAQRKRGGDRPANANGLRVLMPGRHDDQNVHVAVRVRRPVRMRAEEDDLLRMEALGDLAREPANDAHRDIRSPKPAGRRRVEGCVAFVRHNVILPRAGWSAKGIEVHRCLRHADLRPRRDDENDHHRSQGDSKKEADETFYLDLFGASSNSLFTKNRGIGTILNDD